MFAVILAIKIRERRKNSQSLRNRFNAEYDPTMIECGSERNAQAALGAREEPVNALPLRDLGPAEGQRFLTDWQMIQSRFVDHPRASVIEADELVASLMNARGYPVSDFEHRATDVSVNHPRVIQNYRSAHAIAERLAGNDANTEDMRTAMLHYRDLFAELLQVSVAQETAVTV
jgi:hypothetical protein